MNELLIVTDLHVQYNTDEAIVHAVNGANLAVHKGEVMGLVGETGAGKTTLALSVLNILPEKIGKISAGHIIYNDTEVEKMSNKELQAIRGKHISMIFQDPMTSLNPIITVGDQIMEMLSLHFKEMTHQDKEKRVDEILRMVGIPAERKHEYPFQFSGGMKQRVGIAIALVCQPSLLIADEPTTALDVTIQAQILDLMLNLKKELNTAVIMITHDLGIVAQTCDSISVMYAGEIVESGSVESIFRRKNNHPYTEGLFNCIPKLDSDERRLVPIEGFVVDPTHLPLGCKFHERCRYATQRCCEEIPPVYKWNTHSVKCFLYEQMEKEEQV